MQWGGLENGDGGPVLQGTILGAVPRCKGGPGWLSSSQFALHIPIPWNEHIPEPGSRQGWWSLSSLIPKEPGMEANGYYPVDALQESKAFSCANPDFSTTKFFIVRPEGQGLPCLRSCHRRGLMASQGCGGVSSHHSPHPH